MSKSLFEQFTDGVANAITDVREKVVEEGWFGRVVTDNGQSHESAPAAPEAAPMTSTEPLNAWQEKVQQAREQAPVKDATATLLARPLHLA
jgi:hypothetical protein